MNTDIIFLLLLVVAAVCFGLAAASAAVGRINLVALGLFAWVLVAVIKAIQAVQ